MRRNKVPLECNRAQLLLPRKYAMRLGCDRPCYTGRFHHFDRFIEAPFGPIWPRGPIPWKNATFHQPVLQSGGGWWVSMKLPVCIEPVLARDTPASAPAAAVVAATWIKERREISSIAVLLSAAMTCGRIMNEGFHVNVVFRANPPRESAFQSPQVLT